MEPPGGGGGVTGSEVLTHLMRDRAEIPREIAQQGEEEVAVVAEQDRGPAGIEARDVGKGREHLLRRRLDGQIFGGWTLGGRNFDGWPLGGGTLGVRTGNCGTDGTDRGGFGRLPGSGPRRISGPPLQHGDHFLQVHRLGQEVVDPSRQGLLTLIGEHPGREGDHRQIKLREFTADGTGGGQAVHHRHLDVHQDRGEIP